MSVPLDAEVSYARLSRKSPRSGPPAEACTGTLTSCFPSASASSAMNEPSNTMAVPSRTNGLLTVAPTPGRSTKMFGSKSRQSARVWPVSSTRPSPPSAVTGSPFTLNATDFTVGYCVSV